jgi:hypothetical protein
MNLIAVELCTILGSVALENWQILMAVISILAAPIGGILTLWVSFSARVKVLEVQMAMLKDEYGQLSKINSTLSNVNANIGVMMKSVEKYGSQIASLENRITIAETRAERSE